MKFENIRVYNFENALRGMRNPKNSQHLSDSSFGFGIAATEDKIILELDKVALAWAKFLTNPLDYCDQRDIDTTVYDRAKWLIKNGTYMHNNNIYEYNFIGPKDMKLAKSLIAGGSEHRKFLRQIMVTVDITAPLYWQNSFCQ